MRRRKREKARKARQKRKQRKKRKTKKKAHVDGVRRLHACMSSVFGTWISCASYARARARHRECRAVPCDSHAMTTVAADDVRLIRRRAAALGQRQPVPRVTAMTTTVRGRRSRRRRSGSQSRSLKRRTPTRWKGCSLGTAPTTPIRRFCAGKAFAPHACE